MAILDSSTEHLSPFLNLYDNSLFKIEGKNGHWWRIISVCYGGGLSGIIMLFRVM